MKLEDYNILHVANDYLYPPNHGGRVDIWRRLQKLSELGCRVDLVSTLKHRKDAVGEDEVRRHCKNLVLLDRQIGLRGLIPGSPYQWATRRSLATARLENKYDVVLLDSEQCAPVLKNRAIGSAKILLRVHNDEADFLRQLGSADSNWFRKQFYRRESRLFEKLSTRVFARADRLLFSSCQHHERWTKENPDQAGKAFWLPPSATARHDRLKAREGATVLFIGGLFSPSNQEAMTWYLENVHSELRSVPGYRLQIVGRVREDGLPLRLQNLLKAPAVNLVQNAPDVEPYYAEAAVFMNPMRSGASIKVKTVNALEFAVPTVSTRVGNEGTGFRHGEHLLIADEPHAFIASIKALLANPEKGFRLASAGLAFIEQAYDHKRHLASILQGLGAGRNESKDPSRSLPVRLPA